MSQRRSGASPRPARPVTNAAGATITVQRLGTAPALFIEDAVKVASFFFANDASAIGPRSYDARVAMNPTDRFERADIEAINGSMRARSPYEAWQQLLDHPSPTWLADLDPSWDLVRTPDREWQTQGCAVALTTAIDAMRVRRVGRAMATKVLHLKRPALVPILDALVIDLIGGRAYERPTPTGVLVKHLRVVAIENARSLRAIQRQLAASGYRATEVRILDAILWMAHPRSSLHSRLGWPTRLAPP
jgi:hypothetical protein